ncbi:MAG: hypothetical protein HC933_22955 [Pleurocapsa sp. SU_196_0]|nr:hypothetical protein [Pleurocapsa sp. SU_196_0]
MTWRWLLVGVLLLGFSSSGVFGQSGATGRDTMYDVLEVAAINDASFTAQGKNGTFRWAENIAYFFAGSMQFILNGKDVRLSSPIEKRGERWLVPRVFLEALQLEFSEPVQDDPDLGRLELTWEEMDVGKGVRGLHLFYREGKTDTASLLLVEYTQLSRLEKGWNRSCRKS